MRPRPRRDGKRPVSARSARARALRENTLKHPSGIADQGKIERFAARPPDHGKRARSTVAPPDHEKRERFTVAPPDHEKRERFTVGAPDKRSKQGSTRLHQLLFLTPLSVFSLGSFWAWAGIQEGGETRTTFGDRRLRIYDLHRCYDMVPSQPGGPPQGGAGGLREALETRYESRASVGC